MHLQHQPLRKEERNLIDLELMIMEQVQDWELDIGKVEAESEWDRVQDMVVTLPNDQTKTIRISSETQKRSWFGLCPNSLKIGSLKMCGGCKMVGYFSKEDQKAHWPEHKVGLKVLISFRYWTVEILGNLQSHLQTDEEAGREARDGQADQ